METSCIQTHPNLVRTGHYQRTTINALPRGPCSPQSPGMGEINRFEKTSYKLSDLTCEETWGGYKRCNDRPVLVNASADSRTSSSDDATFAYRSESDGMSCNILPLDDRLYGARPARTAGRKSTATTTAVAHSKPGQWRSLRLRCTFSMFGNRCVKWNEMEANRYSRDDYGQGDRFINKRCLGWNCRADEQRLRQVVDWECIRST